MKNNYRIIATFVYPDGVVDENLYMAKDVYLSSNPKAITSGSVYLRRVYDFHRRLTFDPVYRGIGLHLQILMLESELSQLPF